jgi:predicted outer membrane repeat protein
MYNDHSRIYLTHSDISRNTASDGFGGAMFNVDGAVSHVFMSNTTITQNGAKINGGIGGSSTYVEIVDCLFQQNYAESGGALQAKGGFIYNTLFLSNSVDYNNAGINVSDVTIHNSVFRGNNAFLNAAITAVGPITVTNTTIVSNTSQDTNNEGAIINFETRAGQGPNRFSNTIVWGNVGKTFLFPSSGSITLTHTTAPEALPGIGNSVEDPQLDGSGHLRATSPARDTGDAQVLPPDVFDQDQDGDRVEPVPVDLAGQPRIQGAGVDRGAYEFWPEPAVDFVRVFVPRLISDGTR